MPGAATAAIIVNWNGGLTTRGCVEALLDAAMQPAAVIVVDNGSDDGSAPTLRARYPGITVLEVGQNLGFARGNNVGVRYARDMLAPDYLFVLNNDAFVGPEALAGLVSALQANPRAGAAAPKITFGDGRRIWYGGGYVDWKRGTGIHRAKGELDRGQADRPGVVGFASACALLVRRDLAEPDGLFDERYYFMGEDVDLSLRLTRAGRPIQYAPAATVRHEVGASTRKQGDAFIWYHMTRNRLLTVSKHASALQKLAFFSCWPVLWSLHALAMVSRGQTGVARAMLQGIRDYRAGRYGPYLPAQG